MRRTRNLSLQNSTNPLQLQAAKAILLRQKPFLAKYDSVAYKDSLTDAP
jgi:hypothetical protein